MMDDKKAKRRKMIKYFKDRTEGLPFVLPFIFGFIFFFIRPMFSSLIYSFHEVSVEPNELILTPTGFANYVQIIMDVPFLRIVFNDLARFIWKIPITLCISVFAALLLNDRFTGRLFFRTVLFLPIIFTTETVIGMLNTFSSMSLSTSDNAFITVTAGADDVLRQIMYNFGFRTTFINTLATNANAIFSYLWGSGIQIILFILGLQSIPPYLYEVATIEGCTKWESFCKITVPLLTPTMLLCVVYTIVKTFNDASIHNKFTVVETIRENMMFRLHYASAQSWMYSLLIFTIVGLIFLLFSKITIYLD